MSSRVNHAIFPVSLIVETVEILKRNGAVFRRPADFWPEAARFRVREDYLREFARWQSGVQGEAGFRLWKLRRAVQKAAGRLVSGDLRPARIRKGGPPEVFLQHDADRNPENTVAVMEAERASGAVSASYFFRERAQRWEGDLEPYDLDLPTMRRLEAAGFEIGYHLNGPELSNYDPERGRKRIEADVAFFREQFHLRSFVPHGGRSGPKGENNHLILHDGCLDDLIWFYNGRGFGCDVQWSDGHLESSQSRTLPDPREVAQRVKGRVRARFLFHPQYYGAELRPNLDDVGVTETSWWKELWRR